MKALKSYVLAVSMLFFGGICTAHGEGIVGELDATFGDEGKVVTSFGEFGDQAYAVAMQPDGKILAAGSASNGDDLDLAIARYNKDGSLDTSFNTEGKVRISLGDGDEEITAIAVQDDGYIVVAGYTVVDGSKNFVLVRFTPDGELDNSFGEGGAVVTAFGNQGDEITAMTIDDEGRIVVCGYVTGTAGTIVAVGRYLISGAPDITFGDQGVVLMDIGDDALARSIDIDADGRIVLAGSSYYPKRTELMLLRFLASGEFDTGFGQQGIGVPADREASSEGYGVRFMEDGRIMVAGTVGEKGDRDAALYRFTESGQPDASFGDNGVLITSAGDEDDMALAIDVLDNVVGLSGYSTFNTKRDFLFVSVEQTTNDGANVALNADASGFRSTEKVYGSVLDVNGRQVEPTGDTAEETETSVFSTTQFGYTDDLSYAVVLQPDGKAVSVGYSVQDDVSRFAVARYITPVANAAGGGVDAGVNWILTKEPTNVNRTGAFTGGTIMDSGLSITQRGVVYSIAPDPVYKEGTDGDNTDDSGGGGDSGDTAPPSISNGLPSGELASGTTDTTMSVNTNENATCKYSTEANTLYDSMANTFFSTGARAHSQPIVSLENGKAYTYYVRCRDAALNKNTTDYPISFSVRIGPNISKGLPTGELDAGTTSEIMSVTTDVNATCKYSETPNKAYDSMTTTFSTTGATDHSVTVGPLVDGEPYTYYVRCKDDTTGDINSSDYPISFSVAATGARLTSPAVSSLNTSSPLVASSLADESPDAGLVIFNGSPYGEIAAGSSMTYIGAYTSDKSACRFSALSGQDFDYMPETMATADNLSHIAKVSGLQDDHDYAYYVRCRDLAGKMDTSDYEIAFRVASVEDYDTPSYQRLTRILGSFFVATAHAQTDTSIQDTTDDTANAAPTSVFDLSAPTYSTEGHTKDGAGNGSYSSILENLKPGTFYYVRAYALDSNGKVYYGNQVGIKTADSCFIATAAYGTLLHPYVKVLRSFRDQYMVTNLIGSNLVNLYYHYSPPVADYIAVRPFVRGVVRVALLPVVGMGWLVLQIGFTGLALMVIVLIMPSILVYRSYRRLDIYGRE